MVMEMDNKGTILMSKYELGRLLGQGTFAKVYYARNIKTAQSVAIKVIDKEKVMRVGLIDQIKREISVMKLVRHPNIVQLFEVMATKTKIYFVIEYIKGGELFNKVSKGKLKEDVARRYFQQLICAVDFCHSRGVYHRDLKPENLLLDEHGDLKISDFGLSALSESKRQDGLLHTTCGTPAYVAPEVISRNGYDGAKADIWSCGVILYVLLAGFLPFHDTNLMEMYRKIGRAEYRCPNWFPPEVRRLLMRILDPNPSTRISMAKIKENSWFKRGLDGKPAKNESDRAGTKNTEMASVPPSPIDSANVGASEAKQDSGQIRNLNAFDIISLSSGFDLSGLFERDGQKKEVCFTSRQPAAAIISKLEDAARRSKLKVLKREGGLLKIEGTKEGRDGPLSVDVEIFEIGPEFYLVEIKKVGGDNSEYQKLWKEGMLPELGDIVWAWQGHGACQEEEQPSQPLLPLQPDHESRLQSIPATTPTLQNF